MEKIISQHIDHVFFYQVKKNIQDEYFIEIFTRLGDSEPWWISEYWGQERKAWGEVLNFINEMCVALGISPHQIIEVGMQEAKELLNNHWGKFMVVQA